MITRIATVNTSDREFDSTTDVFIINEPDCWRLVISHMDDYRNPYIDLCYERTEIMLVKDYFERFTIGDFCFLLGGFNVPVKIEHEVLYEKLPMLRPGEQTVPEKYFDVFRERNKDQWPRFGIVDVIKRPKELAASMWRVEHMEPILDKLKELMQPLSNETATSSQIQEYLRFQRKVKELDKYYVSADWKKDFETDERGEFPSYLKRGVLSEDGVYDALTENEELRASFEDLR